MRFLSFAIKTLALRAAARWPGLASKGLVAGLLLAVFLGVAAKFAEQERALEREIISAGADRIRLFWYSPPPSVPNTLADFAPADTAAAFSVVAMRCLDAKDTSLPVLVLDASSACRFGLTDGRARLFVRDGEPGRAESLRLDNASLLAPVLSSRELALALPYDRALLLPDWPARATAQAHCLTVTVPGQPSGAAIRAEAEKLRAIAPRGVMLKDASELLDRLDTLRGEQGRLRSLAAAAVALVLTLVFAAFASLEFADKAHNTAILRMMGAHPGILALLELLEPAALLAIAFAIVSRIPQVVPPGFVLAAGDMRPLWVSLAGLLAFLFALQLRMLSRPVGLLLK